MSKFLGELRIKLDSGEQFGISVKRIFKKKFLGIRENLAICLREHAGTDPLVASVF